MIERQPVHIQSMSMYHIKKRLEEEGENYVHRYKNKLWRIVGYRRKNRNIVELDLKPLY